MERVAGGAGSVILRRQKNWGTFLGGREELGGEKKGDYTFSEKEKAGLHWGGRGTSGRRKFL